MGAGITKDALFARWFGAGDSATRTMPRATFGLFAVRDTLTIAAAFTVRVRNETTATPDAASLPAAGGTRPTLSAL